MNLLAPCAWIMVCFSFIFYPAEVPPVADCLGRLMAMGHAFNLVSFLAVIIASKVLSKAWRPPRALFICYWNTKFLGRGFLLSEPKLSSEGIHRKEGRQKPRKNVTIWLLHPPWNQIFIAWQLINACCMFLSWSHSPLFVSCCCGDGGGCTTTRKYYSR